MLAKLRDFFSDKIEIEKNGVSNTEYKIRIATCALLVEMASIDNEFDQSERERITAYFKDQFKLADDEINELLQLAKRELDDRIDLWGFTNLINQNYDNEQKIKVIEMIWEVVYADGKLSAHEDYLVHKFYKMLNLTHNQMIEAKIRVLERLKI